VPADEFISRAGEQIDKPLLVRRLDREEVYQGDHNGAPFLRPPGGRSPRARGSGHGDTPMIELVRVEYHAACRDWESREYHCSSLSHGCSVVAGKPCLLYRLVGA